LTFAPVLPQRLVSVNERRTATRPPLIVVRLVRSVKEIAPSHQLASQKRPQAGKDVPPEVAHSRNNKDLECQRTPAVAIGAKGFSGGVSNRTGPPPEPEKRTAAPTGYRDGGKTTEQVSTPAKYSSLNGTSSPVRAELSGDNSCTALGLTVSGNAPVLKLARALIAAGHDPVCPIHVFRGSVLALIVRSIGEAAGLAVKESTSDGKPRLAPYRPPAAARARAASGLAPPIAPNGLCGQRYQPANAFQGESAGGHQQATGLRSIRSGKRRTSVIRPDKVRSW
jgi:hypothetical protein